MNWIITNIFCFGISQIITNIFRFGISSEVVGKYTRELRTLGLKILELLCEGLGLTPGYFFGGLSENPAVTVHNYPPCPDPSLTLGIAKHRDPSIITILLQEEQVHGLQVLKDGEWIEIEPIPDAFVVNIGLLLQVNIQTKAIYSPILPCFQYCFLSFNLLSKI